MKRNVSVWIMMAIGGAVLAAQVAGAGEQRLEAARERSRDLRQAAMATKGVQQHLLLMKRSRLNSLIDDLEAGKSVDPKSLDALLDD